MSRTSPTSKKDILLPEITTVDALDYAERQDSPDREDIVNADAQDPDDDSDTDSTATNSSDEFDWNAEDDARSAKTSATDPSVKARRGRRIWLAFMKLARPLRVFIIGVIVAGILITPFLVVLVRFRGSPVRIQVIVWSLWFTITWATGCATYLVVDLIPHIAFGLVRITGYKVERMKTTIELAAAVSVWLKTILDIAWMWIALSVIRAAYQPPGSYWTIVNRIMQALFSAGILLLVEKVFLRYVAINFHRKALADRIVENRLGLKALDRLSNAQLSTHNKKSPYLPQFGDRRGHRTSMGLAEGSSSTSASSPTHEKEGTAEESGFLEKERMIPQKQNRRHRKMYRASVIVDHLGDAMAQVALKNSKFNREGEIVGLHSAGRLAKKLYSALNTVYPPRDHLVVEDFYPYFRSTADAHAAFAIFDKDGNGDISKKEMREAVRRIYRERKALTASLKDVGSAIAKLDAVLLGGVLIIFVFICLLIFNKSDTIASLVPLATIVVGFSFIFGNAAQTLFESLIFIFSTHVFDVGDLVLIDDQVLFVREFGLFSTVFRRVDGQEIIAPNSLLANSKLVHNLRRSNSMWESTTLTIGYDTPLDIIEQLRLRLNAYVADNSRDWSAVSVNIDKMEYQNAITLIVAMEHRPNWQDWGARWGRRTLFMRTLKTVLEELDVRYSKPVQPVMLPDGPRGPRRGGASLRVPEFRSGGGSEFGNAAAFRGSEYMARAPTRSISSTGGDRFDGGL